jgi:hypothetical protein
VSSDEILKKHHDHDSFISSSAFKFAQLLYDDENTSDMHIQKAVCALFLYGIELPMFAVHGFVGPSPSTKSLSLQATSARREFLDASITTAAASLMLISRPAIAVGDDVDDLSMPTEDELKKSEVSNLQSPTTRNRSMNRDDAT